MASGRFCAFLGLLAIISFPVSQAGFVAFCKQGGSLSHARAMWEFASTLQERGHRVEYIGLYEDNQIAKKYGIPTFNLGNDPISKDRMKQHNTWQCETDRGLLQPAALVNLFMASYRFSINRLNEGFLNDRPDMMVVDFFADACIDWAFKNNVPYYIYTGVLLPLFQEGWGPFAVGIGQEYPRVAEYSFGGRFIDHVMRPVIMGTFFTGLNVLFKNPIRKEMGMPPHYNGIARFRNRPAIITSIWGFEHNRYLSPHFQMVGLALSKYSPMDDEIRSFIENAEAPILLAFGSQVVATPKLARKLYDGLTCAGVDVIWAYGDTDLKSIPEEAFKNPRFYFRSRVPQMAILEHPRIRALVTHSGFESIHEALHFGKPMVAFYFYGDQSVNAYQVHDAGIGRALSPHTGSSEQFCSYLKEVVPINSTYQAKSQKIKLATRIESRRSLSRAADFIEELLYAGDHHYGSPRTDDSWIIPDKGPYIFLSAIFVAVFLTRRPATKSVY